ncbi:MAG: leucyl aminopeptidase family protein [Bdellovibrionota bacterium]
MSSFASWLLSPRIKLDIQAADAFQKNYHDAEITSIQIVLEGEQHDKEKKTLFIMPKNAPKKLSFQNPGTAHIASHMGALFSAQLLSSSAEENKPIYVAVSQAIKKVLDKEEFEFFLGILQRSVTNKIKKIGLQNKVISLIFNEDQFTKESVTKANAISSAMCTTRTLINMPPNELNPDSYETLLHSFVKQKAGEQQIEINSFDYEKLLQEECTLICAVGQGSQHKPRIIKLTYSPKSVSAETKHVTLVGKGITFDSGGYDIKPSSGMRIMKKDMGGSAAALGIFFACASLNLPVKLSCYLAIAENMVSGHAMRPGDIYKTRKGFHVEIENTDAEGRLVLADALSLACDEKPDWLIDLATLTGAARVSCGPMVDSLFGNNKDTTDLLYSTGIENGDWVWQMPLPTDYENYLDSSVADFMNSSTTSFAGSVTAALFLQKFVSVERWNHIDTYMWCDKANFLWQEGSSPTGKCVRLVTRAIEKFAAKNIGVI